MIKLHIAQNHFVGFLNVTYMMLIHFACGQHLLTVGDVVVWKV